MEEFTLNGRVAYKLFQYIDEKFDYYVNLEGFEEVLPSELTITTKDHNFFSCDKILVIGVGNIAEFNKASMYADTIAFIVPKTFRKHNIVNRLDPWFHKTLERAVPPESFIIHNRPVNVPHIFQVWKRSEECRPKIKMPKYHKDFDFVDKEDAEFAIQRIGYNAGEIVPIKDSKPNAVFYIAGISPNIFKVLDYDIVRNNTSGIPSINKGELVWLYDQTKNGEILANEILPD